MKSVLFVITILSSLSLAEVPDYFARKETVTSNVLGQTSYTKQLDITDQGQIRLTISETGKTQTPLEVKYYGTVEPRILAKLQAAVAGLPLVSEPEYSKKNVAISGHESQLTYIVRSRMGYVVVATAGGSERVHPQARTLTSAPLAIRDLLDALDVITQQDTYEKPNLNPYCVNSTFNGVTTISDGSGYIKEGDETNFVLQHPGCRAFRVVAGQGFNLKQYTLEGSDPLTFKQLMGYGYGLSVTGIFNEATGVFTATQAYTTFRID